MKAKYFQRRLSSLFTRTSLNRISKARVRRFVIGQVSAKPKLVLIQGGAQGTGSQK